MDKLEKRLKADAADIRAEVSDELAARIDASIRALERAPARSAGDRAGFSLWWISSLTGVAATLLVIAILNRDGATTAPIPAEPPSAVVVPNYVWQMQGGLPLRAETADLTEPLEEELERLKSDLDKARDNLREDLRRSF